MKKEKTIREYDRFIVRLPDGMRERITQSAAINGRSMNAEIVAILTAVLDTPDFAAIRALRQDEKRVVEEIDETNKKLRALRRRRDILSGEIRKKLNADTPIDKIAQNELDEIAWEMKVLHDRRELTLKRARERQHDEGGEEPSAAS